MRKVENIEPLVQLISIGPAAKLAGCHRNTLERRLLALGDRAPQPKPHVGTIRKWDEQEIRLFARFGVDFWKIARDQGEQAALDQMELTRVPKGRKWQATHNDGGAAELF